MWWYIRDDKEHYLHATSSNQLRVGSKAQADAWDDVKAKNILKCLPKTIVNRHKYYLEPITADDAKSRCDTDTTPVINTAPTNTEAASVILEDAKAIVEKLKDYRLELAKVQAELATVEKTHTDLLHIIELDSPKNARDGYQMYKALRDCRNRRRELKDLSTVLSAVVRAVTISEKAESDFASIDDTLKNRVYYMRVLEQNKEES